MNTKLGISVGLLGALVYFAALFGGWIPALLIAGYVLLCETDTWLKKASLTSVVLLAFFALVNLVIGFLPDLIGLFDDLFHIFGGDINTPTFFYNMETFLYSTVSMIRMILYVILGLLALKGRGFTLPLIGRFVEKNTSEE